MKLVSAGTGKKEKLAYAPKPDAKQHVEIAMDLRAKQDSEDDVSPTMVIIGDATAKKDPSGGYAVLLSVTDANAKDAPGSKLPAAQLQAALGSLIGMTIAQLTQPNGTAKELALHIEKPDGMTGSALQVLDLAWPNGVALPAEPVGVGAKWDATMKTHLAQKLDVTRVTTYELVSHTGNVWKLKETTKVTGPDQEIEGAKATDIAGTGTGELTLTDGAIYPTGNTQGETHFTVASADKKVVLSITTGAKITTK